MSDTLVLRDVQAEFAPLSKDLHDYLLNMPQLEGKLPVGYAVTLLYQGDDATGDTSVYSSAMMPLPIQPEFAHMELNSLSWAISRSMLEAVQRAANEALEDVDAICNGERENAAPTETDTDAVRNT